MSEDKLEIMMMMQHKFQNALGTDFGTMSDEESTAYVKEHSIHATQEMHEMLYDLPFFKPWKDYSGMGNIDKDIAMRKARKEFIDMFHFVMNMALGLGLTANDIFELYYEKNVENYKRQEEGYTHDKQYR